MLVFMDFFFERFYRLFFWSLPSFNSSLPTSPTSFFLSNLYNDRMLPLWSLDSWNEPIFIKKNPLSFRAQDQSSKDEKLAWKPNEASMRKGELEHKLSAWFIIGSGLGKYESTIIIWVGHVLHTCWPKSSNSAWIYIRNRYKRSISKKKRLEH